MVIGALEKKLLVPGNNKNTFQCQPETKATFNQLSIKDVLRLSKN